VSNGAGVWSITNLVGGVTPSSFTINNSVGFQINLRTSANTILGLLAKAGGILNSAVPGVVANAMTEVVYLNTAAAGFSPRLNIALYETSLVVLAQHTTFSYFVSAFFAGRGRSIRGNRRFFQLANIPDSSALGMSAGWFTTITAPGAASRPSRVEYGNGEANITFMQPASRTVPYDAPGDRIGAIILSARPVESTPSASGIPCTTIDELGFDAKQKVSPLALLPSISDNQAWLYVNNAATATDMVILWNKTVDPALPT